MGKHICEGESHYLNCQSENCERAYCVDRRVNDDLKKKLSWYQKQLDATQKALKKTLKELKVSRELYEANHG